MTDVAGGLITLEYALAGLKFKADATPEGAARDADITTYIQAATPIIEKITGPLLQRSAQVLVFNGGKHAILLPADISSAGQITQITEDGATIADYDVDVDAGIIYAGAIGAARAFNSGVRNIRVTVAVGRYATADDVPKALQLAARELVRILWQLGMQSNRPAYGEVSADTAVPDDFLVPRRVLQLCEPYRQVGFA